MLPSRIGGIQFSWTWVGLLIPICLHCWISQSDRPREEKSDILQFSKIPDWKVYIILGFVSQIVQNYPLKSQKIILVLFYVCRILVTLILAPPMDDAIGHIFNTVASRYLYNEWQDVSGRTMLIRCPKAGKAQATSLVPKSAHRNALGLLFWTYLRLFLSVGSQSSLQYKCILDPNIPLH